MPYGKKEVGILEALEVEEAILEVDLSPSATMNHPAEPLPKFP